MLWEDDGVGDLKLAVVAFLCDEDLTPERFGLVVAYLKYFLNAPCWVRKDVINPDDPKDEAFIQHRRKEVCKLRFAVNKVITPRDVWALMADCMEVGLHPL